MGLRQGGGAWVYGGGDSCRGSQFGAGGLRLRCRFGDGRPGDGFPVPRRICMHDVVVDAVQLTGTGRTGRGRTERQDAGDYEIGVLLFMALRAHGIADAERATALLEGFAHGIAGPAQQTDAERPEPHSCCDAPAGWTARFFIR